MASSEPWQVYPGIWKSEAAFFAYLRGGLRLIWSRYPAKLEWKKGQMVPPPPGYTGRAKSLGTCHYCKCQFPASKLEVDHVLQAGECNSWTTAADFLHKLLDCNDNWVLACKPCHKIKSYAERAGISFEAAYVEKRAIEFMKQGKKAVMAFCLSHGYPESKLKNDKQRRAVVTEIFEKETSLGTNQST